MIKIPQNSRYYLDLAKAASASGDFWRALRMLALALNYCDDKDEEYDCMYEKLNVFDALHLDVRQLCYDAIARQAEGEEMYAALFNAAISERDADLAAYYLDMINFDENIPEITSTDGKFDRLAAKNGTRSAAREMISELAAQDKPPIRFVNGADEVVENEIAGVIASLMFARGKNAAKAIEQLKGIKTDTKEQKMKVDEAIAQCAALADEEDCRAAYADLFERAGDRLSIVCAGSLTPAVRKDKALYTKFKERMHALVRESELSAEESMLAAYALCDSNMPEDALFLLEKCDTSPSNLFARRTLISALMLMPDRVEEGEKLLEETLLLEQIEDRIVWEYYRRADCINDCFEFGWYFYSSAMQAAVAELERADRSEFYEILKSPYGVFLFRAVANILSVQELSLSNEKITEAACIFADEHLSEALKLLYERRASGRIKRLVLHRLLYFHETDAIKDALALTCSDGYLTTEEFGFIYRNDVTMDSDFDSWPDRVRLACCAAVSDCCFYNNYIKGQIRDALWDIREKSRHMRGVVSYETIYRAVVIKLNPDMRDVLNITGLDESERRRMEAVAKKFDLELE